MRRVRVFKKLLTPCILILSSAAFYAASFLTDFCWFFSFFCFVPLFVQRFSSYRSAVFTGCLWASVAYGFTLSALLEVIIRLGVKPTSYWYALGFLGYFVFFTIGWCVLALFIKRRTQSWAIGWLVSSFLYFSWMHIGFFYLLTGHFYGYPLACPLLPLMKLPALLVLLPVGGWCGLLAALLGVQVGIAQRKKILVLTGLLPFFVGFFVFNDINVYEKKDQKIVLISQSFHQQTPYERAQEVRDVLCKAEQLHTQAQLFVLPESAFPFPLNDYQYAQELWSQVVGQKYLVVGSHYSCVDEQGNKNLFNSAYVLQQGRIIHRYDKKLLLPFFEEQPFKSFFLRRTTSPFLIGKTVFDSQETVQDPCTIPGLGTFSFRICSELLWDIPTGQQILVLVNDGHYPFAYFPRLFKLFAQFQALEKQSALLYCSWG